MRPQDFLSYHVWRRRPVRVRGGVCIASPVGVVVAVSRHSAPASTTSTTGSTTSDGPGGGTFALPAAAAAAAAAGAARGPGAVPLVDDEVDGHLALETADVSVAEVIAEFVNLEILKEKFS